MANSFNVLSLFDGISAGRLALDRAMVAVSNYYRSEIDKYASQVAMHHYLDDIQLGDVTKWREWDIDWSSIDLLIGGSPCQGFSFAGKQAGTKADLNGVEILVTDRQTYLDLKEKGAVFLSQSHLFWEYVLILDHVKKHNPNVKFLLENVRMKKELLDMISDALGVKDIVINSSLVSAQNRHRHYWCNWEVDQPEDKGILLKDIVEQDTESYIINQNSIPRYLQLNGKPKGLCSENSKSKCLTASIDKGYGNDACTILKYDPICRDKSQKILSTIYKENAKSMIKREKMGLTIGFNIQISKQNVIKVGNVHPSGNGMNGNVYALEGKAPTVTTNKGEGNKVLCGALRGRCIVDGKRQDHKMKVAGLTEQRLEVRNDEKTNTLTTVQKDNVMVNIDETVMYRKLTPTECARLQTFPDGWCESIVSKTQAYKAYGNSWTVDVIAHIFKCGSF